MKTSQKILLTLAGLIVLTLIIYVSILHNIVQSIRLKAESKHTYKILAVDNFQKLHFSSPLIVSIKQGKECKIDYTSEMDSIFNPRIENINGTLFFAADTISVNDSIKIQVRISMPDLHEIKASNGAQINLGGFQTDSLSIILENGCSFNSKDNTLKKINFRTSGENKIQITYTMP